MPLNELEFVKWSWTVLMIPIGWLFKMQWAHRKEVAELKVHVAEHYTPRRDVQILDERIFRILQRIESKIDGKADK